MPNAPNRGTRREALIVGAGLMGRWHAHACRRAGGRVVALVDTDATAAASLGRRLGVPWFSDLERALGDVDARLVHVCTPAETHAAVVRTALEADRHVLVEKPVTPDAQTSADLVRRAESRGLLLVPVYQFLFQPGVRRILARPERWAPLRHVIAVACSAGAREGKARGRDRIALEIVPHFLYLLGRLRTDGLDGLRWTARRPVPGELGVLAEGEGVTATFVVSMSGRPTRNTLEIVGEGGSAYADLFHGFATFEPPEVSRARKVLRPFDVSARRLVRAAGNLTGRALRREPAYPGLRTLVDRFYGSALSGEKAPISPAEILAVGRASEEIAGQVGERASE